MKIKITTTIDIDPEAWMMDYGVAREEVRADVQTWAENMIHEAARMNGMVRA